MQYFCEYCSFKPDSPLKSAFFGSDRSKSRAVLGDGISHKIPTWRTHFADRCDFALPYGKWHFISATISKNRFTQLLDMHQVLLDTHLLLEL